MMRRGAVYTIANGTPFLPALVRALVAGQFSPEGGGGIDPLDLSATTILLPTRRAERALADACLSVTGRRAMLLPRIRAISGPDEDQLLVGAVRSSAAAGDGTAAALELPPAIDKTERLLLLTRLVLQWSLAQQSADGGADKSSTARTPAQACTMARELAELMDLVEREGRTLDGLADLVPETFSEHWQKSVDFLKIITEFWPSVLSDRGLMSPWDRQNRLLQAEAERLRRSAPSGPVIVAGVTGSIPATVELMQAVCGLEQGAIVLPGLDLDLDDESWEAIAPGHPEHPEFGLKRLLKALGVSRAEVKPLDGSEPVRALSVRGHFISEAMRPTETTAQWHDWVAAADKDDIRNGLQDVQLIEAANPPEEAEAIALIMREAAEHKDKHAALVTPDRLLARRVAIRLESWGIRVDDSAGRPFTKTVPGAFLELVIDAIAKDFAPVQTMALLKHPLARFGLSQREVRFAARALELKVFRQTYIGRGLDGLETGLKRARTLREEAIGRRREQEAVGAEGDDVIDDDGIWHEDWQRAQDLVARMRTAFAPLLRSFAEGDAMPLDQLAAQHAAAAEAASRLTEEEVELGAEPELYKNEAGQCASSFFTGLIGSADAAPAIPARDYPDLYRGLVGTLPPVIPSVPKHPRLSIWGPMESQLLSADVVILGSLNETTWPDSTDPGPWLNRPMRAQLELPSPEEDIGREARGFVSLMGAREVYLTRAKKVDGVPSVPSRWLLRMSALIAGLGIDDALSPKSPWLAWARARDAAPTRERGQRPEPRPPLSARPRHMSVSGIERWIMNPYAVFAGQILRLRAMHKLGAEPDAALKGQILHEAMSKFALRYPEALPVHARDELTDIAKDILEHYVSHPKIAAFWIPRFERFADWFVETEEKRRKGLSKTMAEIEGAISVPAPAGSFRIVARADRLDLGPDGLIITDYKTGTLPTGGDVKEGRKPQLPLEAAIAAAGGFAGLPREQRVLSLRYIKASGAEPPGEEREVRTDDGIDALARDVLAGVTGLIAAFDDAATPYAATRRSGYSYDYDDYAHLARVAEWAQQAGNPTGQAGGLDGRSGRATPSAGSASKSGGERP